MSNITLDVKVNYEKYNKAERRFADFIMSNPQSVVNLSITELSKKSTASEATIVRFSRKLGFTGFKQLKIAFAQEDIKPINKEITPEDSAYDIFVKECEDIYCSIEKTKKAINPIALENTCKAIMEANEIIFFGLGNSASIAQDATHKLLRLGLNARAYTDNHMQAIVSSHTTHKSVVVGISHSGNSIDIVNALELAKNNGAITIGITNLEKSKIEKVSDYVLNTVSDETNYRILGLSSRITQLAIIDAIYSYLVCHLPNSVVNINMTESALKDKKYKKQQ